MRRQTAFGPAVPIRYPDLSWRERCRPLIARILSELEGADEKQIRKALRDAYPFGERRMYPYRAWLLEIKAQRGALKRKAEAVPDGQLKLGI